MLLDEILEKISTISPRPKEVLRVFIKEDLDKVHRSLENYPELREEFLDIYSMLTEKNYRAAISFLFTASEIVDEDKIENTKEMFIKYITTIKNLAKENIKLIEPFASGAYFAVGRKDIFDKYCEILDTLKILAERSVDAAEAVVRGAVVVIRKLGDYSEYIKTVEKIAERCLDAVIAFGLGLEGRIPYSQPEIIIRKYLSNEEFHRKIIEIAEKDVDAAIAFAKGALWVLGNEKGTKEYLHNRNFINALVKVGAKNARAAHAFAWGASLVAKTGALDKYSTNEKFLEKLIKYTEKYEWNEWEPFDYVYCAYQAIRKGIFEKFVEDDEIYEDCLYWWGKRGSDIYLGIRG